MRQNMFGLNRTESIQTEYNKIYWKSTFHMYFIQNLASWAQERQRVAVNCGEINSIKLLYLCANAFIISNALFFKCSRFLGLELLHFQCAHLHSIGAGKKKN